MSFSFSQRHIGPDKKQIGEMLSSLGFTSIEDFIIKIVPNNILSDFQDKTLDNSSEVETINKFVETPQCLQEVATGAGKTIITATLSHICEKIGRTLVIVPNKSLVTQTEEDYINVGLDVGVYFGDRKELGKTHTICTWQSLNNF